MEDNGVDLIDSTGLVWILDAHPVTHHCRMEDNFVELIDLIDSTGLAWIFNAHPVTHHLTMGLSNGIQWCRFDQFDPFGWPCLDL